MSRRDDYVRGERYDDRDRDYRPRPRRDGGYDEELDIDIHRSRSRGPERRTDAAVLDRRDERRERVPDFLREDYGRPTEAQQLVVREDRRESDNYSRVSGRRRSNESLARSRAPERVREEEIIIKERDRERDRPQRPPYPLSDVGRGEREVERERIVFQDGPRSRAPSRGPPSTVGGAKEEIDITIRRREDDDDVRSAVRPRGNARAPDHHETRIRDGRNDRPPPSIAIDREEINVHERRRVSPARSVLRGREGGREELDIHIRETERREPSSRPRSRSRGTLVARKDEEWLVRRPRREPSPPPRDYEKEEIIIRRRERSVSPDLPPREPTPEPLPPPVVEPIVRPPIVQEVITHYRNIDHGFERAREPTPPPPPPSPPRDKEEDLEIAIRRSGTRNGKAYDEELIIEHDHKEREDDNRVSRRQPSVAPPARRRSPSRSRYDRDEVAREAEYYNRQATSRGYPGEAWNGATKRWELVDIPPGTERVRMDGAGGGAQEITWQRYNGERTSKFYAGDRVYEQDSGRDTPPKLAPSVTRKDDRVEETRIDLRRTTIEDPPRTETRHRTTDKMWTEVAKDLVIKEAIVESGYDFEETDEFYYVMEYLRYEDVVRLVELTDDIRRERRERIREIQREREELDRAPKMITAPPPSTIPGAYDERIYEREYVYDREGRRHHR